MMASASGVTTVPARPRIGNLYQIGARVFTEGKVDPCGEFLKDVSVGKRNARTGPITRPRRNRSRFPLLVLRNLTLVTSYKRHKIAPSFGNEIRTSLTPLRSPCHSNSF